jgi:dihydroorotase-like cyclic amidohydrolase
VKAGHATIKVFMTYGRIKLDDMQLLDVLYAARENQALVCVHAENHARTLMCAGMVRLQAFNLAQRQHQPHEQRRGFKIADKLGLIL